MTERAEHTAFTPGPWKAIKATHGPIDIFDIRGRDVVTVYGGGVEPESKMANARLIASAPDLLAALIRAREVVNAIVLSTRSVSFDADLRAIDAALSRATGEA